MTPVDDIAALLERAGAGDDGAWRRLVDLVYPDLKRLARGARAQPRDATLGTTALVHECYLRLARAAGLPQQGDLRLEHAPLARHGLQRAVEHGLGLCVVLA
ncbi:MAG TPA: ECF-type sigma factor, partial [Dokdonella sp.]|nr:ECF-type sigma factor [Dokdonella sp.]